ncbi:MAG TPA: hypothetical protein GX701_03710 [Clostridiales bacterium]|nr:hypothetical protein [Clostridiales bacterium]
MKGKIVLFFLMGFVFLCLAACQRNGDDTVLTEAPHFTSATTENPQITTLSTSFAQSTPIATTKEPTLPLLIPDLGEALPDRGEVILSLPIGEGDEAIRFPRNQDKPFFESPDACTFSISDHGEVYIGGKSSVRVFKDNQLVSVHQFPYDYKEETNIAYLPVGDLTILNGTLYLADLYMNRVYAVVDENAVPLDLGNLGNLQFISATHSGKLVVNSTYYPTAKHISYAIPSKSSEQSIPVILTNEYTYENDSGLTARMTYLGNKTYRFDLVLESATKHSSLLALNSANLNSIDVNGAGQTFEIMQIGTDGIGRIYLDANATYYKSATEVIKTERFLIRLDVDRQELSIQKVDHTTSPDLVGALWARSEVDKNGNVYLAFASLEEGLKIVKYRFEN